MQLILVPILFISVGAWGMLAINKAFIFLAMILGVLACNKLVVSGGARAPFFLCLIVLIISLVSVLEGSYISIAGMIVDLQFMLIFLFALIYFSANRVDVRKFNSRFIAYLIWALIINLLVITIMTASGTPVFMEDLGVRRFNGTIGASGSAIFYLGLFVPFFSVGLHLNKRLILALSIIAGSLIFLCGTRIVLLAMLLVIILNIRSLPSNKSRRIGYLFVFSVFAIVLARVLSRMFFGDSGEGFNAINTQGRITAWLAIANEIFRSPIIGHGAGAIHAYLSADELSRTFGMQIHNDYIKLLFNSGVAGLTVFISMLVISYRNVSCRSMYCSPQRRVVTNIAQGYIIAFATVMMTDNIFVYHFYLYPFLIYLAFALSIKYAHPGHEKYLQSCVSASATQRAATLTL